MTMAHTLIAFEDHGQDFLYWTVDETGKVVDCQPFQAFLWCLATVTNLEQLKPGKIVEITLHGEPNSTRYPVTRIVPLVPTEIVVRLRHDGYETATVKGLRASCTWDAETAVGRLADKLFPLCQKTIERMECAQAGRLHSRWRVTPVTVEEV